jgi:hypothetical protein
MEKKYFTEFFKAFPFEFSEHMVIKMIHKSLECAEKYHKHKDEKYIKYMVKAYHMLQQYFREKGVNPDQMN